LCLLLLAYLSLVEQWLGRTQYPTVARKSKLVARLELTVQQDKTTQRERERERERKEERKKDREI
jgi:hypothetical protein